MGEDEEDFVYYGTPIEREEDTSSRKRKSISDAGQLRSLPIWKQEVTDMEGRRRFHGAFTGGFSAGYYNTAGSKEGWTPETFTSSRTNRAKARSQSIHSFIDDEDIKDMGGYALETSSEFDTFGFTAAEVARKQAEIEQQNRPSAIPGPVPDELVLPAANSIGIKLLTKMGWRHGRTIKEVHTDSLHDARREARKAFLAFSGNEGNTESSQIEIGVNDLNDVVEKDEKYISQIVPVYVLNPKHDLHGLGFDPFKHAPEFRGRKMSRDMRSKDQRSKTDFSARNKILGSNSGKYAPGFGIGALEELDIEDEDIYSSGLDNVNMEIEEEETPKETTKHKLNIEYKKKGVLAGFKVASSFDYNLERFQPPVIPSKFEPFHKFTSRIMDKFAELPPSEVPPPENNNLKLLIEGIATLVARCGKIFEDLSREKNKSNPLFSFLSGGNGHEYYQRKLWEAKQKGSHQKHEDTPSNQKLTAESRGRILGEKPLERSSKDSLVGRKEVILLQSNLTDTFTKPSSSVNFSERLKPFKDDPAKQERFEQFLKDKYEGGLRSTDSRGMGTMSDDNRARERLDFEAAAEAIEKGEWSKIAIPSSSSQDILAGNDRFISSSSNKGSSNIEERTVDNIYPKREEFEWRPAPILCKRFDLVDPYMGKPPAMPRARSKLDSLIFMPDSFRDVNSAKADITKLDSFSTPQHEALKSDDNELRKDDPDTEDTSMSSVQRPVDLYKAIFSDDSDDEAYESVDVSKVENPEKKIEGVNMTLNRLVAGDFLESLGKEFGLEIPEPAPAPAPADKTEGSGNITTEDQEHLESSKNSEPQNAGEQNFVALAGASIVDTSVELYNDSKDRKGHRSRKHKSHSRHRRSRCSSDTDTSGHSDRYMSRSEKRSSSSKRHSRKHSKHPSHRRSRSPSSRSRDDKVYSRSSGSRRSRHSKHRDDSDDDGMRKRSRDF